MSSMHRSRHPSDSLQRTGAIVEAPRAVRALATGALAVGAFALGAVAVGAVAIGALAIGRLAIGRARIGRLQIDELSVRRLVVTEELRAPQNSAGEPSTQPVSEQASSPGSPSQ